jgi:homoserine kinase
VVLVPPFEASTEQARGLLPPTVPHTDAAANAGRAALLVAALIRTPEQLFAATEDRLHQQYRAPAMPASAALVQALRSAGLPAVISGAGPTVLVLAADDEQIRRTVQAAPQDWRALPLPVRARGAAVVPGASGVASEAAGNTPGPLDVAGKERTV